MGQKELNKISKLIEMIRITNDHAQREQEDTSLWQVAMESYMRDLKSNYEPFLMDQVFDLYDDYFEDDTMGELEDYILDGVDVYGDELAQGNLTLKIQLEPLRFEVQDETSAYRKALWKAA